MRYREIRKADQSRGGISQVWFIGEEPAHLVRRTVNLPLQIPQHYLETLSLPYLREKTNACT
jgi:hypothetical protein